MSKPNGVIEFIKSHWLAYIIAASIAVALGFGAAYVFGVLGSTPAETRAEHVAAYKAAEEAANDLRGTGDSDGADSSDE